VKILQCFFFKEKFYNVYFRGKQFYTRITLHTYIQYKLNFKNDIKNFLKKKNDIKNGQKLK